MVFIPQRPNAVSLNVNKVENNLVSAWRFGHAPKFNWVLSSPMLQPKYFEGVMHLQKTLRQVLDQTKALKKKKNKGPHTVAPFLFI